MKKIINKIIRNEIRWIKADKKGWNLFGCALFYEGKRSDFKFKFYIRNAERIYKLTRDPKNRSKLLGA